MDPLNISYVLSKTKLPDEYLEHLTEDEFTMVDRKKLTTKSSIEVHYKGLIEKLSTKNLIIPNVKSNNMNTYNFYGIQMENPFNKLHKLTNFIKSETVQQNILSPSSVTKLKETSGSKEDILDIFPSPSQFYKEVYKEESIPNFKLFKNLDKSSYSGKNRFHSDSEMKETVVSDDENLLVFLSDEEQVLDSIDEHDLSGYLLNMSVNDIKDEVIDINESQNLEVKNVVNPISTKSKVMHSIKEVSKTNLELSNELSVTDRNLQNKHTKNIGKNNNTQLCDLGDSEMLKEVIVTLPEVQNNNNEKYEEKLISKSDTPEIQIVAEIVYSKVTELKSKKQLVFEDKYGSNSKNDLKKNSLNNKEPTFKDVQETVLLNDKSLFSKTPIQSVPSLNNGNENIASSCFPKDLKTLTLKNSLSLSNKSNLIENVTKKVITSVDKIIKIPIPETKDEQINVSKKMSNAEVQNNTNLKCIDQNINVQEEKLYLKPFKSTNERENEDINDPNWNIYRKLKTDEERYLKVREHWKNITIPDPNMNLTYHGYRWRHHALGKGIDYKEELVNSSLKRPREYDDESQLPTTKRPRAFQNLTFNSRAIDRTLSILNLNFMDTKNDPSINRNRANKLEYRYREYVRQLQNAREEAEMVHKFYFGLPNQKMLTQRELEKEQWDIEQVYNMFKRFYNWSGRVFNPVISRH